MFPLGLGEYLLLAAFVGCVVGWYWQTRGLKFRWGLLSTFVPSVVLAFAVGRGFAFMPLFVAFVAFVIGALQRPNLKAMDEAQLADGQMKKCPFCAELIKTEARVCRFCGKELAAA